MGCTAHTVTATQSTNELSKSGNSVSGSHAGLRAAGEWPIQYPMGPPTPFGKRSVSEACILVTPAPISAVTSRVIPRISYDDFPVSPKPLGCRLSLGSPNGERQGLGLAKAVGRQKRHMCQKSWHWAKRTFFEPSPLLASCKTPLHAIKSVCFAVSKS